MKMLLLFLSIFSQIPDTLAPTRIEPGDVLEIVVLGEEELSRTLMVMHNGLISFPLIGDVHVDGLTTDEAANLLVEKLKKYFTHPAISVILKSPSTPHVSVFGEVLKPGAVEYQRGLKVTDYVALAGGTTHRAGLRRIKVIRIVSGKPVVETINLASVIKSGKQDQNFELKSGDWIYIPSRFTINWATLLQAATLLVSLVNLYIIIQND
jgi:polysaccharide export outer membrane protein